MNVFNQINVRLNLWEKEKKKEWNKKSMLIRKKQKFKQQRISIIKTTKYSLKMTYIQLEKENDTKLTMIKEKCRCITAGHTKKCRLQVLYFNSRKIT